MEVALFLIIWLVVMGIAIGGLAFWIVALVEVCRIPDHQYRAAATEKTTWVLIVVLVSWIGALIWWFGPRQRVREAVGANPYAYGYPMAGPAPAAATPAGWYPDPGGSGRQRWWDGRAWTDQYL